MLSISVSLSLLIGFVVAIWYFVKKKYTFWERHGIAFVKPVIPYGNVGDLGVKFGLAQILENVYNELKGSGPYGGMYFWYKPTAVVLTPEFAKRVLIKDFQHFHDRGIYHNEKADPLTIHLFAIEGEEWRNMRKKLTPTFTSGKMKFMHPTILAVADRLRECLLSDVQSDNSIEIKDLIARFTTDVIGEVAFGIECNSLKDKDSEFRQMGRAIFDPSRNVARILFFLSSYKGLARRLNLKIQPDNICSFFSDVVEKTLEYRERTGCERNDFMNLLIKIKNQQKIGDDDNSTGTLSFNQILANTFLFFFAGFETSSTTMTCCLYLLAQHKDIQGRVREEIRKVLEKYDGQFTYEAINELNYLEQVVNETLRLYGPANQLIREVTKDYYVPETKQTLKKGQMLIFPIRGFHFDPEYYPEPNKFNPDRFSPEEVEKRNPFVFMPFGDGPRACIGNRFALLEIKTGLASLLRYFTFDVGPKTVIPIKITTHSPISTAAEGVWLDVKSDEVSWKSL